MSIGVMPRFRRPPSGMIIDVIDPRLLLCLATLPALAITVVVPDPPDPPPTISATSSTLVHVAVDLDHVDIDRRPHHVHVHDDLDKFDDFNDVVAAATARPGRVVGALRRDGRRTTDRPW